jgi:hypothetical protein
MRCGGIIKFHCRTTYILLQLTCYQFNRMYNNFRKINMVFVCRSATLTFKCTCLKETGQESIALDVITMQSSQHDGLKECELGETWALRPLKCMLAWLKGRPPEDYRKFPNAFLSSQLILLICTHGTNLFLSFTWSISRWNESLQFKIQNGLPLSESRGGSRELFLQLPTQVHNKSAELTWLVILRGNVKLLTQIQWTYLRFISNYFLKMVNNTLTHFQKLGEFRQTFVTSLRTVGTERTDS